MWTENKVQWILNEIEYYKGRLLGVVVHINDTYLLDERPPYLPGFPRVIATIDRIREHTTTRIGSDRVLVVHSGDFLAPSRVAESESGRMAMITLLNKMGLNYCVLGNHEFDYGETALETSLEAAQFEVLLANVHLSGKGRLRIRQDAVWPANDPVVALTGVVSSTIFTAFPKDPSRWSYTDPNLALQDFRRRQQHLPFHLVLSHAERTEDRAVRQALEAWPRTYFLGGHDHNLFGVENDSAPFLMKNLANLQTVRVLLLLAGGDQALQMLLRQYSILSSSSATEPTFPEHTAELLQHLSKPDARVFRAWIDSKDPLYTSPDGALPSVDSTYFTDKDDVTSTALVLRLAGLPFHEDMLYWLLRFSDHELSNADAEQIVNEALDAVTAGNEDAIVRDFTQDTPTDLNAREESIRSSPTDFGIFVAECVRLKGDADLAIVNSGSFRSDAYLPRLLKVRDLLDTFLYDSKQPSIVVLDMTAALANALLQHGRAKPGLGAYPQVASRGYDANATIRVAISSFLLLKEQDGYAGVVEQHTRMETSEIHDWIRRGATFRIVDAIIEHGPAVPYALPSASVSPADLATTFLDCATKVSALFNTYHPYADYRPVEWNDIFKRFLSGKSENSNTALTKGRDEIRDLLLRLPNVSKYCDATDSEKDDLRPSAITALRAFRHEIVTHPRSFEGVIDYYTIFDAVAAGIAGYRQW